MQNTGVCVMCKYPLFVDMSPTGKLRPFCPDCEKKVLEGTRKAMAKRGKEVGKKAMHFPNIPKEE